MVFALFTILGVATCFRVASAQDAGAPLHIEITADRDVVPSGSPVKMKAEVTNTSSEVIRCSEAGIEFAVQLRDGIGNLLPTTEKYRESQRKPSLRRVTVDVAPGETKKWGFILSDMYDLSKVGQYSVQIGWNGGGQYPLVLSNTIGFKITAASSQTPEKPTTSFSLEIEVPQDVLKDGSTADVVISATNNTTHDIVLDDSTTLYSVEVRDQSQIEPPLTDGGKLHRKLHGNAGGNHIHVKPGETAGIGGLPVGLFYDFRQPGIYTIQIARMDQETQTLVKSNTINITVKP
jgi:hypothetical protein